MFVYYTKTVIIKKKKILYIIQLLHKLYISMTKQLIYNIVSGDLGQDQNIKLRRIRKILITTVQTTRIKMYKLRSVGTINYYLLRMMNN